MFAQDLHLARSYSIHRAESILVVKERYNIGFEANFFNLFNRANFGAPVSTLTNPRFGRITSNLPSTNPRQIQFGLKLSF